MSNVIIPNEKNMAWNYKKYDFTTFESAYQLIVLLNNYSAPANKMADLMELNMELDEIRSKLLVTPPADLTKDVKAGKIYGAYIAGGSQICYAPTDYAKAKSIFKGIISNEDKPQVLSVYNKTKEIAEDIKKYYKSLYAERKDEEGKKIAEYVDRFIAWIDLNTRLGDPTAGNIAKAQTDNPVLQQLNALVTSAPKFAKEGFEKVIKTLEPENGPAIYKDYMTLMTSGAVETEIQYERQKAEENGGWSLKKEEWYLKRLKASHKRIVEAFDRLWDVEATKEMDDVLNNHLDHTIGKSYMDSRDVNDSIGYLRGETQAIDMGYDSMHLYILGQVGLQDQLLKKYSITYPQKLENTTDPEEKAKITANIEALNRYKAEFETFKNELWNTKVNGKAEMEAVEAKVDKFFKDHDIEPFKDIQKVHSEYKSNYEYKKNAAKDFVADAYFNERSLLNNAKKQAAKWSKMINDVDFFMLGKGSKEFDEIVKNVNKYKETVAQTKPDKKGVVSMHSLIEIHELEEELSESLTKYLLYKREQFKKDPKRRDDPARQKREQPRLKAVLDVFKEVQTSMVDRTDVVVDIMQKERANVEKLLEAKEKKRKDPNIKADDYQVNLFASLKIIDNLDGKKWVPEKNESLRDYCSRLSMYSDPDHFRYNTGWIKNQKNDRVYKTFAEEYKKYKENKAVRSNDDLKFALDANNKDIDLMNVPEYDAGSAKSKIGKLDQKIRKEFLAGPEKEVKAEGKKQEAKKAPANIIK
jgi:hypothetical protein